MRRSDAMGIAILLMWATAPVSVLAADEHGGGGDPVQVDLWQAGYTIVVFVLMVILLSRFAFKPILNSLKDREAFIRKSLADAEEASKKAERQLAEYTAKLDKARSEASAIVDEGRRDAEAVKKKLLEDASSESAAMIDRAKREIGIARDSALREIYDVSGTLATQVASRIVGRELSAADHERLIQESINELKEMTVQSG